MQICVNHGSLILLKLVCSRLVVVAKVLKNSHQVKYRPSRNGFPNAVSVKVNSNGGAKDHLHVIDPLRIMYLYVTDDTWRYLYVDNVQSSFVSSQYVCVNCVPWCYCYGICINDSMYQQIIVFSFLSYKLSFTSTNPCLLDSGLLMPYELYQILIPLNATFDSTLLKSQILVQNPLERTNFVINKVRQNMCIQGYEYRTRQRSRAVFVVVTERTGTNVSPGIVLDMSSLVFIHKKLGVLIKFTLSTSLNTII